MPPPRAVPPIRAHLSPQPSWILTAAEQDTEQREEQLLSSTGSSSLGDFLPHSQEKIGQESETTSLPRGPLSLLADSILSLQHKYSKGSKTL